MATQIAISKQHGGSLIEFMVASSVGIIAIGIIGSLFISAQKSVSERGQELLLLQNMTSTLQQMKEEMQRAGFDGVNTGSLMLSGALSTVHTASDQLGYVYRIADSGSSAVRNTVYKYDSTGSAGELLICEKSSASPLTFVSAAASNSDGYCYSLFQPEQIDVTSFNIDSNSVIGESASSAITRISLSAKLVGNPLVTKSVTMDIKHRNWQ